MAPPRIWLDSDVALGASHGDVDDGFALAALLGAMRQGRAELLGISSVFGNTSARESEMCAREIAARSGMPVRIVRGAEAMGADSEAAEAIAALPAGVELLCLGPLTNIAGACRRDPSLFRRLSLRAVGGNLSSPGFLPPIWPFEFNFSKDRAAARFVLTLDWRELTLTPLDVARQLRVGQKELDCLEKRSSLGRHLALHSRRWLSRSRWLHLALRFPVWDLSAALDAIGALSAKHAVVPLARGGRRLLRSDRKYRCLVSMDTPDAWSSFLRLLDEESVVGASAGNELNRRLSS